MENVKKLMSDEDVQKLNKIQKDENGNLLYDGDLINNISISKIRPTNLFNGKRWLLEIETTGEIINYGLGLINTKYENNYQLEFSINNTIKNIKLL